MKRIVSDFAAFGGAPLFDFSRPVGQLSAPTIETFLSDVRALHAEAYSGDTRARQLEEELADFHGARHCVSFVNAGVALITAMELLAGGRSGYVAMPAFSYRGLPPFARWAGQTPLFCDVEEQRHGLSAASLEALADERLTCVLAVNNVTSACDVPAIQAVAARVGVPVVYDSVYALGATHGGVRLGGNGVAEVFSLHATKLLNGFEGGYVTTNHAATAEKLRSRRDAGLPSRLNEVHAAMALRSLGRYDEIVAENRARFEAYRRSLRDFSGLELLAYRDEGSEAYNYGMAILQIDARWPLTRDEIVELCRKEGLAIAAYYSPPLYRSQFVPAGTAVRELPVTEMLARRYLQLPVGEHTSLEDIERIAELLASIERLGDELAAALREQRS